MTARRGSGPTRTRLATTTAVATVLVLTGCADPGAGGSAIEDTGAATTAPATAQDTPDDGPRREAAVTDGGSAAVTAALGAAAAALEAWREAAAGGDTAAARAAAEDVARALTADDDLAGDLDGDGTTRPRTAVLLPVGTSPDADDLAAERGDGDALRDAADDDASDDITDGSDDGAQASSEAADGDDGGAATEGGGADSATDPSEGQAGGAASGGADEGTAADDDGATGGDGTGDTSEGAVGAGVPAAALTAVLAVDGDDAASPALRAALRDVVVGDLGAWQRDPGAQLGAVEQVVSEALASGDLPASADEAVVTGLDGEALRALAWAVVAARAEDLDADAMTATADRVAAHLDVARLALQDAAT